MRDSKNILYSKLGVSPMERQYGGGLDDAYMNRSRSNAFADPNANTAFASPISQGGLPTVYREDGGGISDEDRAAMAAELDQADFDAGALTGDPTGRGDAGENYVTIGEVTETQPAAFSQEASKAADRINEQVFGKIGRDMQQKYGGDAGNRLTNYSHSIPTQQDYIDRLNKEGFPTWTYPYYNALKSRGMTNDEATARLASAMATPGGLSGMQAAYEGDYSYGGPMGTMKDLLETGTISQLGLEKILKEDKKRIAEDKEMDLIDNPDLPESFLESIGLGGLSKAFKGFQDLTSIQGEISPRTEMAIEEQLKGSGWEYQPVSPIGQILDYGLTAAFGFPATIAKGLANLTDTGKTIGTITKDGMSFNVNVTEDGGRLSINMPEENIDYNDPPQTRQPRPVQQKAIAPVTKEKPKKGISAYYDRLNKSRPAQSRVASNKYIEDLLKDLYRDPRNRPTLG